MKRIVGAWVVATLLGTAAPAAVENLEVSADRFEHIEQEKRAVFEGHAHAIQGKSRIDADRFVVYFDAKGEAREYQALGHVHFEIIKPGRHIKGRCDRLIYKVAEETYRLIGHTRLKDLVNQRSMSGDEIFLDNKRGRASAASHKKGPVKFVFPIKDATGSSKKSKKKKR